MVHIEHETAKQLASDITSAHLAIDQALADLATLTSSVIDACRHSDASLAQSQAAIEGAAIGLSKMVDARKGFMNAHRRIAVAQRDSNLQEVNFGCAPGPLTRPSALRVVNG
jgi:hypothetical protein